MLLIYPSLTENFPELKQKPKLFLCIKMMIRPMKTIAGQYHCLLLGVKFLKELCIFDCITFSSINCCLRINNLDSAGNTVRHDRHGRIY